MGGFLLAERHFGGVVVGSHHLGLVGRKSTQLREVHLGILVDGHRHGQLQDFLCELCHVNVKFLDVAGMCKPGSAMRSRSPAFADIAEDLSDAFWVCRRCNKGEDTALLKSLLAVSRWLASVDQRVKISWRTPTQAEGAAKTVAVVTSWHKAMWVVGGGVIVMVVPKTSSKLPVWKSGDK